MNKEKSEALIAAQIEKILAFCEKNGMGVVIAMSDGRTVRTKCGGTEEQVYQCFDALDVNRVQAILQRRGWEL